MGQSFVPIFDNPPAGYVWSGSTDETSGFYRLRGQSLSAEALGAVVTLNRRGYDPTPDLLERVLTGPQAIGAAAYIAEQLTPETIPDTLDVPLPMRDWQWFSVTAIASSSTLSLYPSEAGDVYVDDLTLVAGSIPAQGPNEVWNGDFKSPLAGTWNVSTNLSASHRSPEFKRRRQYSLHLVASTGGTTRNSALWQEGRKFPARPSRRPDLHTLTGPSPAPTARI